MGSLAIVAGIPTTASAASTACFVLLFRILASTEDLIKRARLAKVHAFLLAKLLLLALLVFAIDC